MELESFDAPHCSETAGFLFKHNCSRRAGYRCDLCGKEVCSAHRTPVSAADLAARGIVTGTAPGSDADACTSCVKRTGVSSFAGRPGGYDDPYWYSGHYHGYGSYGPGRWGHSAIASSSYDSDPSDFTEADGESLRREGDDSFEMETSGS